MKRNRNLEREIEAVKDQVYRDAAPTIEKLNRIREEDRRLRAQSAQMAREWQLIRGEG
jgi:septation ring formation regulator EzrA